MKGLGFLGNQAKQLKLSFAKPWLFQGSRKMASNATNDFSENQSVIYMPLNVTY